MSGLQVGGSSKTIYFSLFYRFRTGLFNKKLKHIHPDPFLFQQYQVFRRTVSVEIVTFLYFDFSTKNES
jgi:hypothetical protein